jgi:hypothetical protein
MTEHPTPLEVPLAFTEAWTSHDMATAASYLPEEVLFEGPINRSTSARAYIEGLSAFARHVTGMKVLAALGDDEQALIMYDVTTGHERSGAGTLTCAEHLTVREGKIERDKLTFDTYPVRKAQGMSAAGPGHAPAQLQPPGAFP